MGTPEKVPLILGNLHLEVGVRGMRSGFEDNSKAGGLELRISDYLPV